MRVAVLASGWNGYNDTAFRKMAALGVELLVVFHEESPDTAYNSATVADFATAHPWKGEVGRDAFVDIVAEFDPDVVMMHSWHFGPYRAVMKRMKGRALRVLWMDNVWRNTPKQWLGRAVAPVWVHSIFDCVMTPSDRTENMARRLGFGEGDVIRGSLSADTDLFGSPPRTGAELADRRRFVACLRLVHHKGADVLAEAYARYRNLVEDPWSLRVIGLGPQEAELRAIPGVELPGFLQPSEVAEEMRAASCLVIPSREDPYGVVVHEGALSRLPIITTYFVGAAPYFVQDGRNGWTVPGSDAEALAQAMVRMSTAPVERLEAMSEISGSFGSRFSSEGWALNLTEEFGRRRGLLGLPAGAR